MRISDKTAVERIMKAIADPENGKILMQIRKEAKSSQAISKETEIPQSTVYRKLDELRAAGLIMTEHFTVTSGKRVDYLVATFSELRIAVEEGGLTVNIVPSGETANLKWLDLFRSG